MKPENKKQGIKRCIALMSAVTFALAGALSGCTDKNDGESVSAAGTTVSTTQQTSVSTTAASSTAASTSAFVTAKANQQTAGGSSSGTKYYSNGSGGSSSGGNSSGSNIGSTNGTTNKDPQKTEDAVYNDMAIQRKFGFNYVYDKAVDAVLMNIEEVRTYFTYNGYDWLLEFWKGEYELVTVGAEVGIYYHKNTKGTPPSRPELYHYNAVDNANALYMSMELWQCDSKGERKVLTMPRLKYWWMAAFSQGMLEKHSRRTDLVMVATVEFKDSGMLNACVDSFKNKPFTQKTSKLTYKDADAYYVNKSNNSLQVSWRYLEE